MATRRRTSGQAAKRPQPDSGLQINEHRGFQNVFWHIQRVCWVGLGLLLVAACLGFTGDAGLFARQTFMHGGTSLGAPAFARQQTEYVFLQT